MGKITLYDDTAKINAAYLYAACGNYSKVARDTNIPRPTIMSWAKDSAVWDASLTKAQQEISDEILAYNLEIVIKSNEQILDRIDNGDTVLTKSGDRVRVPLKGRDLAIISGIKEDKARVALGQATSITKNAPGLDAMVKKFEAIADSYNERQARVVSVQKKSEKESS